MKKMKLFLLLILSLLSFKMYAGGYYTLNVGESMTLSFTPKIGILTNTIRWMSNAGSTVEVESYIGCSATIKALKPSTVQVIVQCSYEYVKYNGTFPYYITATEDFYIKVKEVLPTQISIPNNISMTVGDSRLITPTIYPSNATTTLTWESDDPDIVSVYQNGSILAHSVGNTTIKVSTDNGLTDYCNVSVIKPTLNLSASLQSGLVEKGSQLKLTTNNANARIYYTIDGSTPNENSIPYTQPINIDKNMTINAIAIKDGYNNSPIVQRIYNVSSLKKIGTYPQEGEYLNRPSLVPSIVFNTSIEKGEAFSEIKLIDGANNIISGNILLHNNMVSFIPEKEFAINKSYKLIIPQGSLINPDNEINFSTELEFHIKDVYNYKAIYGGEMCSFGIKSDNTLWAWGTNQKGNFGNSKKEPISSEPIKTMDNVIFVSAGLFCGHSLLIKADKTLWAWGNDNYSGQLGNGTTTNSLTPVKIMDDIIYAVAGSAHSLAIKSDSTLWAWGNNTYGQLGNGTTTNSLSPIKIMDNVIMVSARGDHSVAIKSDGSLWVWGCNQYGQLGDGTTTNKPSPIKIAENVISASANLTNTFYIKSDGTLWEAGVYNFDNISYDFKYKSYRSSFVKRMENCKYVDASFIHVNVLKHDNSVWTWGYDGGRLGSGNSVVTSRDNPMKITDDATYISSGLTHTICKKTDNTWWAWGINEYSCFGIKTTKTENKPIKIVESHDNVITQSIKLNDLTLGIKDTSVVIPFNATLNADYKSINWTSSNENVVNISDNGLVYGLSIGESIITATITNYDESIVTASCKVVVNNILAEKILLNNNYIEAKPNDEIQLVATIFPKKATNKEIEWTTSDQTVAQVDNNGLVRIIRPGNVNITAKTTDGTNLSAACVISVPDLVGIKDIPTANPSVCIVDKVIDIYNLSIGDKIYLYSINGQIFVADKATSSQYTINVSSPGIYILKIKNNTNKIIIR